MSDSFPPLPILDGCLLVDNSFVEAIMNCPTLAAFKHLYKRERRGTSIARDAGRAVHAALEWRYSKLGNRRVEDSTEIDRILAKAYESVECPEDDYRTLGRISELVAAYNQTWLEEPFEVLGVELPFAVELGTLENGLRLIYTGRIDLLARWTDIDEVLVVDHKTMSDWKPSRQTQFEASTGPKGYAWSVPRVRSQPTFPQAVQAKLAKTTARWNAITIERVNGFCLNAIVCRKPLAESTLAKIAKSPAYAAKVEPRNQFLRQRFYYNEAILEEWRINTLQVVWDWVRQYERGRFTMSHNKCAYLYGGACQFYGDVCAMPPELRMLGLASDIFEDVTFDPLETEDD